MIVDSYLDLTKQKLLREVYGEDFLESIDEDNFLKVYHLFVQYGFYFIDDIILNNLELFLVDPSIIETGILKLQQELGPDYVKTTGMDMRYLEKLSQD